MKDCMMMQARLNGAFLTAADATHAHRRERAEPVRTEETEETAAPEHPRFPAVHHRR